MEGNKPPHVKVKEEAIPAELKTQKAWVLWRWEKRDGKLTKPPYQPSGKPAESDNPATWSDFTTVLNTYRNGGGWDGIGYMLHDGLTGVDFDDCVDAEGKVDPEIEEWIKLLDSYTEVSPSGKGFKTLLRGKLPRRGHHGERIGVFSSNRYFCITGRAISSTSPRIESRQEELNEFVKHNWPRDFASKGREPTSASPPDMEKVKRVAAKDEKFSKLWAGDHSDYPSQSEADQALCCKFAYYFKCDFDTIDHLFRQSGLMRDKWGDREDYRRCTIENAIELTEERIANEQEGTTGEEQAKEKPEESIKILRSAVLDSEDFLTKQMPAKTVFLDPWLMALSIILITGARGVGKSWFLLSLLLSIVRKFSFGPWAVANSVPCLFLDGEMAASDMQDRLKAIDPTGYRQSPLYIYSDAYASSQGLPRANLLNPAWRTDMKSLLLDLGVKVWAVDNIASLTPGIDENSKQEWDPINQWLLELRFNEITTILAHHTNRAGGQRGTSGREDNIDISILLKQPDGYTAEDGASFIATFTKARIAIPHLSKIADTAFQMQIDAKGRTTWEWNFVRQNLKAQIIALHQEGLAPKDIAKDLKCSLQNVYKTIKKHENG